MREKDRMNSTPELLKEKEKEKMKEPWLVINTVTECLIGVDLCFRAFGML